MKMTNYDLNKLLEFARNKGISLKLNYCEPSDELEIETSSPALAENHYMKRCSDIDRFIESWQNNFDFHVKHPNVWKLLQKIDWLRHEGQEEVLVDKNDYISLSEYIKETNKNNVKEDFLEYFTAWGKVTIRELT